MKQIFNMIHWAGFVDVHWVLMIFVMTTICLGVRWIKTSRSLHRFTSPRLQSLLVLNASLLRRIVRIVLYTTGIIALSLAILRPQWDKKEEKVAQEGRDILIAIDISRSMLCTDELPNRLEFVKQKVKKLLYNLSCERVGLILFSGKALVQCPLTEDFGAFFMFLDNLDTETISVGTTALDGVIRQALAIFEVMKNKKTKLLCLFTDGEDFSTHLSGVKEKAAQEGLSIFTFGVGTLRGAPIPILDKQGKQIGFEKDSQGNIIMSKLNEGILSNLASQTGGVYIHLEHADSDIKHFISLVQRFEKDSFEDKSVTRLQEQYSYCIMISFVSFALEWLL